MKKVFSAILAAVMLLSTLVAFALPTSAAGEVEGDWTVWGSAKDYEEDAEDPKPVPGYKYTEDGFQTISPDFTNHTPWFTVQTKDAWDLSNGFSMEVRIDEFPFAGEMGADMWISFSIWSQPKTCQGDTSGKYGYGWLNLMRGYTDPTTVNESQNYTTGENGTELLHVGTTGFSTTEKDGKQYLTFEVSPDWEIKVCGEVVTDSSDYLEKVFPNHMAYIGVSFHSGVPNASASCTITKVDGAPPQGSDSREPDQNNKVFAEIADSDTVAAGQPAVLYDANNTSNAGNPSASNATVSVTGEDKKVFHVLTQAAAGSISFSTKNDVSYEASDFPYIAVLFKDYCTCSGDECNQGETGTVWYCAGEVMSPDGQNNYPVSWFDYYTNDAGESYQLGIVDLSVGEGQEPFWSGRIHSIRVDFSGALYNEAGRNTFDICYVGTFRTEDDAYNYAYEYMGIDPETLPTEEPTTEAPTEEPTEAPTTEGDTTVPSENGTNAETDAPDNSGCKSVAGLGAISVMTVAAGAGVAVSRKKRKK